MADELHTLRVESIDERLAGRARLGKRRTLRIPGALPGELVRIRVDRRGRGGRPDLTTIQQIWEAHDERRVPFCSRHSARAVDAGCTGCSLQHAGWSLQRAMKRDWLRRVGGIEVEEVEAGSREVGYRQVSKRVVGGTPGALVLGSYIRGSHVVASMEGCPVEHPRIRESADELVEVGNILGAQPWDENAGDGDLRFVWMKTDGRAVLTTLVMGRGREALAKAFAARLSHSESVAWSVHGDAGNRMRGTTCEVLRGPGVLSVAGERGTVEYGPLGFMQPNPEVAAHAMDALVTSREGRALEGAIAWDLYAGSGATTRRLRPHFGEVEACDVHVDAAGAAIVEAVEVEAFLAARESAPRPDVVVANPPRGGMGASVCAALRGVAPARIHIMSCNPKSLRRDMDLLLEGGFYELEMARAFDTLPHTDQLEVVVHLIRVG